MLQKRILIIDDDQDITNNISRILSGQTYATTTASSIKEAIKILVEQPIDLITCDLMIPANGGFELIEQIKADPDYTHIPILIISGIDNGILSATRHEADDVLTKPFTSQQLLDKVSHLLENEHQ